MKKLLALLLALAMVFGLVACGSSSGESTTAETGSAETSQAEGTDTGSTEKAVVSLTMWGAEEDQTMLRQMADEFIAAYADQADITITLGVESEATAKDTILTDVTAAADVYAFADDQINELVAAGALQAIPEEMGLEEIKSANVADSVEAATVDGTLYAYPMTADNGYFLLGGSRQANCSQSVARAGCRGSGAGSVCLHPGSAGGLPCRQCAAGHGTGGQRAVQWPALALGKTPNWETICRFVSAGVCAVREELPAAKIMIHLDNGGNRELYRTWFDHYFQLGGTCDIIGLSYYPFWHGTLEDLAVNLNEIAPRYGKDLIVAETSMGFTMDSYAAHEQLDEEARKGAATRPALVERVGYAMTPEGQAAYTRDLLRLLRAVPEGRGKGLFWWEPAWIPVPGSGWAKQAGWEYVRETGPGGNEWANQALFDFGGNALPALKAFCDG